MATRREILRLLRTAAAERYPMVEAEQIAEIIIEKCGGVSRNHLIVEPDVELAIANIDDIIADLRRWRPVQYIVGSASFADMELEVGEGVLIPRPETEELVAWIASESAPDSAILDVCTGSGCIAIALSRAIHGSHVEALDLSREALAIARRNADRYAPDICFYEADALGGFATMLNRDFDIIVSNPPYIPTSDIATMRRNVTEHEPQMALFVPDDDPLCFYRSIARNARHLLVAEGKLYFEIYEGHDRSMVEMLHDEGYKNIRLREDFRAKPRMICAEIR